MITVTLMASALAAGCELTAPALAPMRIELYTSEGCSSCPPAERWMNALPDRADTLPLAFHVDYWDYLGWRDRFADSRFSARQQRVAARFSRAIVYTPAVAIDGNEWRWRTTPVPPPNRTAIPMRIRIDNTEPMLQIAVDAEKGSLHVAVTESSLRSTIRAGENRGTELTHDHVVRVFGASEHRKPIALKLPNDLRRENARIAIWLEDSNGGTLAGTSTALACGHSANDQ